MAAVSVIYATVAAGNFLWRLAGQDGLPPIIGSGAELWDRLASLTKSGRGNAKVRRAIESALARTEYSAADEADVMAADQAVSRALTATPAEQRLIAAATDRGGLQELLSLRAQAERSALISEPAQAVFDLILGATEAYLVKTALASDDFGPLAHQEELRDLAHMADEIRDLSARLGQLASATVRLLAGPVLMLNPPVRCTGYPIEPSRLLAPTSGAFPFVDRGACLEGLVNWVDDPAPFGVHVVGGVGGSGKTRLAVELCRRVTLDRSGYWRAGFIGADASAPTLSALGAMPGGRLIVIDYAETRPLDVAAVMTSLSPLATSLQPVRVLLLVRSRTPSPAGVSRPANDPEPWRASVRPLGDEAANSLLDDAGTTVLSGDSLSTDDRDHLFTAAIGRLPAYMGLADDAKPAPFDTGHLGRSEYDQPLNVAMAAYLCLAGDHVSTTGPEALFEAVLRHEARYWQSSARLPAVELSLNEPELRLLVALATLSDVSGERDGAALLGQVEFLRGDANALLRQRSARWLSRVYALEGSQWGQLVPDRLGEYLVADQLADQPWLVRTAISPTRSSEQLVRPLRTLGRACADNAALATMVATLLDDLLFPLSELVRRLASTPNPWGSVRVIEALTGLAEAVCSLCLPDGLIASSRALGLGNRLTAGLGLAIDRAVLAATHVGSAPAARAEALSSYAARLAETGRRDEALAPAREAVDAFQVLARANPATYSADLAMSLNNYANRLAQTGQLDEALGPAREAVDAYRALAQANHSYIAPLANSLDTYARRLAETGHWDEALAPVREAVDTYRALAHEDPAAHDADLAMSLNSYATRLAQSGQRDDALARSVEALGLRRRLAQDNPAVHTPALASSLNNYANRLAEAGQLEGALAAAREAVELRRVLAQASPAAYIPALGMSLNNYAVRLAQAGQWDEALAAAREAVDIRQVLAQANPATYTPALASSLSTYAMRLSETARPDEALAAAREAVEIRRALVKRNPAAYTPALAMSLNNYADRLAEAGQQDEAQAAARESVELRRALAHTNPAVHGSDLATSLNTFAVRLGEAGQIKEALAAAHEAVRLRRALALGNPIAYMPAMATVLNTYANRLAAAGRIDEAVAAARESVDAFQELVRINPAAYGGSLQSALTTLSRVLLEPVTPTEPD